MSIYASLEAPDDSEHAFEPVPCDAHREEEPGIWGLTGKPCTCGAGPIVYVHSGCYPDPANRGGSVDIAFIPSHISPDGKDHFPEDGPPHPYLRLGVAEPDSDGQTVLLDEKQVEQVYATLGWWLRARKVGLAQACAEGRAEGAKAESAQAGEPRAGRGV